MVRAAGRAIVLAAAFVTLAGTPAHAVQNGFGFAASAYSPADDFTEELFDIDRGPVWQFYYRLQAGEHGLQAGFGTAQWDRQEAGVNNRLTFFPVFASYRYLPWPDKPVSLVVGGGMGFATYDANVRMQAGNTFLFEDQTGVMMTFEPVIGIEFRATNVLRITLDYKYSVQLFTTDDFNQPQLFGFTDVDLSGGYASFGLSFLFG